MRSLDEIRSLGQFLKSKIQEEKEVQANLIQEVEQVFPQPIAVEIIGSLAKGVDPIRVVERLIGQKSNILIRPKSFWGRVKLIE